MPGEQVHTHKQLTNMLHRKSIQKPADTQSPSFHKRDKDQGLHIAFLFASPIVLKDKEKLK